MSAFIKQAIEKEGKENFKKEILFKGSSYRELLEKEAEIGRAHV